MTRAQKRKILYRAAEIIATGDEFYSCWAIDKAQKASPYGDWTELAKEYTNFYCEDHVWPNGWSVQHEVSDLVEAQRLRVLMLLMFAEAGLSND
jgi:hypothetical protein